MKEDMDIKEHILVHETDIKQRLSDYLPGKFESIVSKKGIKKAIEKGLVRINGRMGTTGLYVRGGEKIELLREQRMKPKANLKLEVLYEDDYLAVINKPAGVVVSGNKRTSIENALQGNLKNSNQKDGLEYPEPVHRLDYPTSGLLLIGKTSGAVTRLNKLFEGKEIEKVYHAVTIGSMSTTKGKIETSIKGKVAETHFEILQTVKSDKYECLNLVRLKPVTGRRHQIRIHMAEIGNPILGDKQYGKEGFILRGNGLYLHATSILFQHPYINKEITVEKDLPKKIKRIFA